jgi:hypothetical protein
VYEAPYGTVNARIDAIDAMSKYGTACYAAGLRRGVAALENIPDRKWRLEVRAWIEDSIAKLRKEIDTADAESSR